MYDLFQIEKHYSHLGCNVCHSQKRIRLNSSSHLPQLGHLPLRFTTGFSFQRISKIKRCGTKMVNTNPTLLKLKCGHNNWILRLLPQYSNWLKHVMMVIVKCKCLVRPYLNLTFKSLINESTYRMSYFGTGRPISSWLKSSLVFWAKKSMWAQILICHNKLDTFLKAQILKDKKLFHLKNWF